MLKKQAPVVNLDLTTIHFPITAIASILHRISGVALFLLTPLVIWLWAQTLLSAAGSAQVQALTQSFWMKFLLWAFLSSLIYHLIAGVKHLFLDLGFGESIAAARLGAQLSLALFAVLAVLAALWLF